MLSSGGNFPPGRGGRRARPAPQDLCADTTGAASLTRAWYCGSILANSSQTASMVKRIWSSVWREVMKKQDFISLEMAVSIVILFEIIQVNEQNG